MFPQVSSYLNRHRFDSKVWLLWGILSLVSLPECLPQMSASKVTLDSGSEVDMLVVLPLQQHNTLDLLSVKIRAMFASSSQFPGCYSLECVGEIL